MALIKNEVEQRAQRDAGLGQVKMGQHGSWLWYGLGPYLVFNWTNRYATVLENAFLEAQFYRNQPPLPGLMTWDEPEKMKLLKYRFELLRPGIRGFVAQGSSRPEFNENVLAEHILKSYIDEADQFKARCALWLRSA